jgi:hypothetical protein
MPTGYGVETFTEIHYRHLDRSAIDACPVFKEFLGLPSKLPATLRWAMLYCSNMMLAVNVLAKLRAN